HTGDTGGRRLVPSPEKEKAGPVDRLSVERFYEARLFGLGLFGRGGGFGLRCSGGCSRLGGLGLLFSFLLGGQSLGGGDLLGLAGGARLGGGLALVGLDALGARIGRFKDT